MKLQPYLLAVALIGGAFSANADTVSYSDTFGPDRTAWDTTLSVPKFDPALGELQSVTITYSSSIRTTGTVKNKDAEPKTLTVSVTANVTLNMPAGVNLPAMSANVAESQDYPNSQPNIEQNVEITGGNSETATTTNASDLNAFSGAGNVTFNASADSQSEVTGAANLASDIDTFAGVTVQVTYNYQPPLVSALQCGVNLSAGGDTVTATVSGDEGCTDVNFVETITCSGDLVYTVAANTPGCQVVENPNGTFTATCAGVNMPKNSSHDFSIITSVAGTDGSCVSTVTSMSCVTPSGATLNASNTCSDSFSVRPPPPLPSLPPIPPNIPTLSQWGLILLAGLLGVLGYRARRKF